MKAILLHQNGGPEQLRLGETSVPTVGSLDLLVKMNVSGVNFVDIYLRDGLYPIPSFPHILGIEGAGIVVEKGDLVTDFCIGDRVGFAYTGSGSYAEYTCVKAERAIPLPESIGFETAAACLLQGLTAHFLTHTTFPLKPQQTILVHAAAGGVGGLIVQMAKLMGATVLGTVSTPEKAQVARSNGADQVILYHQNDFETEVMDFTNGIGVDVVYDSVGVDTFDKSLNLLKNCGMLVLFGQSSGLTPPFDLNRLCNRSSERGSFFVTRPTIRHYIKGNILRERAADLFNYLNTGKIKVRVGHRYSLTDAANAHRDLSARLTIGKSILKISSD
ncbi:MAG: quinone oxidoreductase [Dolichospermum lemmermannii FEM_B0920]|jgi:NADPH2:quinone reductase